MTETRKCWRCLLTVGVIAAVGAAVAIWWFWPGQQRKWQLDELASLGHVQGVEAALADGADVNSRYAQGITPLMCAARGHHPDIANPAPTDHPDVVELLIKRGADVNAKADTGLVALFLAARYGHDKAAKVLIDNGADVSVKDKDGMTALKWATTNQQAKVIALLQAAGAKE